MSGVRTPFLEPVLRGARFNGGAIPLSVLRDFAALQEMLVEVAKAIYLEENPSRKRTPAGFTSGVSFAVTGVREGSAVPVIAMVLAGAAPHPEAEQYFQQARDVIVTTIAAAESDQLVGRPIPMPNKMLGYFNRFGSSLEPGELIEFTTASGPVRLTPESRRRLVLAQSDADEFTERRVMFGSVYAVDHHANTFSIILADGTRLDGPLSATHVEELMVACRGYKSGLRARFDAYVVVNRRSRPQRIELLEHAQTLDALDPAARLDEIGALKPGWLGGQGRSPDRTQLDWLATQFDYNYPGTLPYPRLYPTESGGVRAEWDIGGYDASLDFNLANKEGYFHALHTGTDDEVESKISFEDVRGWATLIFTLTDLMKEGQ